jgi:thymidine kinase
MIKFITGTMKSGKSMKLIKDLLESNRDYMVFKPDIDKRNEIESRKHFNYTKPHIIDSDFNFLEFFYSPEYEYTDYDGEKVYEIPNIYIDECQFLTITQIKQLEKIVNKSFVTNVYFYGLLSDFNYRIFNDTIQYILIIADKIIKLKSVCDKCEDNNAKFNYLKEIPFAGSNVLIGDDAYDVYCSECLDKIRSLY